MSKKKNEHFSGYFNAAEIIADIIDYEDGWDIYITKVIYNNPATIVFWSDGAKTISKCYGPDEYNPQVGLLLAILKRFGKVSRILDDWAPTSDKYPSCTEVRDVRARNK